MPIETTLDTAANLAAQERMRILAGESRLIVPGHDPEVFQRFAGIREGVVRID